MTDVHEKIIEYIDIHITDEITADDLAKAMGYSKRHLYKLFQAYNDMPIMEYIRNRKLSAAANELRSDKKMYAIALDYGYETPAGFYKAFRSIFGCSPSDYKNNIRSYIMTEKNLKMMNPTELNQVIADYTREIKLEPNNAQRYIDRAFAYCLSDQYDKALDDYDKSIELAPNFIPPYFARGHTYAYLEQYDCAIDDYTKVISLDAGDDSHIRMTYLRAFINRGFIYDQLAQSDKADEDFNNAAAFEIKDSDNISDIIAIYLDSAYECGILHDKAILLLSKVIELAPLCIPAHFARGYCFSRLGQYDRAIEDFTNAIALEPSDDLDIKRTYISAYLNRAHIYNKLKQHDKAEADFNKAVEWEIRFGRKLPAAWTYWHCGDHYEVMGQYDKAIENYNKAIELDPNSVFYHARESLDKLNEKLGRK